VFLLHISTAYARNTRCQSTCRQPCSDPDADINRLLSFNMNAILEDAQQVLPEGKFDGNCTDFAASEKQAVYHVIANRLFGQDGQTIANALVTSLADGKITPAEWRQILQAWVSKALPNDPIAQDINTAIADGQLTADESIGIGLKWVESTLGAATNNATLKSTIDNIRTVGFSEQAAINVIQQYLANAGLGATLAQDIMSAITNGKITGNRVLKIIAEVGAAVDPNDFGQLPSLINKISSAGGQMSLEQTVIGWINGQLPKTVSAILTQIQEQNCYGVLATMVGAIYPSIGSNVVGALTIGNLSTAATNELANLLTASGLQHAGDVASAITDIVTGTRCLFANGPKRRDGVGAERRSRVQRRRLLPRRRRRRLGRHQSVSRPLLR
jgi:hypothetical protein